MNKLHVPLLLAVAFAVVPSTAEAAERPSTTVRYADLDLASPFGVATFHGRVKAAADRACGRAPLRPFSEASAVAACRDELFRSAAAQLNATRTGSAEVLGTR